MKRRHLIHINPSRLFPLRDSYGDDAESFFYELGKRLYGINCMMMAEEDHEPGNPLVTQEQEGGRSAWLNLRASD